MERKYKLFNIISFRASKLKSNAKMINNREWILKNYIISYIER